MTTETTESLKIDSVGVFFEKDTLESAIASLKEIGVEDQQMGLLCSEACLNAKLGHLHQRLRQDSDSADSPDLESIDGEAMSDAPYATFGAFSLVAGAVGGGALVATVGVLGGALAVAATASGVVGGIGALTAGILSSSEAEKLQEQLDAGHILLFVRTEQDRQKDEVIEILTKTSGIDPVLLQPKLVAAA